MAVLIGMTSYNRLAYTKRTLRALLEWCERVQPDVRIVVVDDASTDGSSEWLGKIRKLGRGRPWLTDIVLQDERQGHAVASNIAWRMTSGDYVKFDNDVLLRRDDWLDVLRQYARIIPAAGVVGHNCEITLHRPYPERELYDGIMYAPRVVVAGACILIPHETRDLCGRWNEHERNQGFNRGLDLVYGAKVKLAGLREIYTTGRRDVYVKCLTGGESTQYAAERTALKRTVPTWTHPVIAAYKAKRRALNDVR